MTAPARAAAAWFVRPATSSLALELPAMRVVAAQTALQTCRATGPVPAACAVSAATSADMPPRVPSRAARPWGAGGEGGGWVSR